jgi:hypothetical protein
MGLELRMICLLVYRVVGAPFLVDYLQGDGAGGRGPIPFLSVGASIRERNFSPASALNFVIGASPLR